MRIKSDFSLKEVNGSYIVTASGESARSFSASIVLQKTAVFMWNQLKEKDMSKEQVVGALLDNFDISTVLALRDADSFFRTLKENEILEGL